VSTKADTSLRLSRVIQADPDTVFRAWTEPAHLKQWSCPEGLTVAEVQVDLRVGGAYMIRMEGSEGQSHTAVGVYREIERPTRLVYTWDWVEEDHKMGETVVTVEFNEMNGSTEVVLTHDLFPAAEAKESHETGWSSCLDRLEGLYETP
jgi:uncharacterized protein YndB with AHSA1/START domain